MGLKTELDCLNFLRDDERNGSQERPQGSGSSLMSSDDLPLPESLYVCWFVCLLTGFGFDVPAFSTPLYS